LGPSGSGKSTLLNILGTLEPPTAGRVLLDGRDPFALGERELARFRNRAIGFVFQDHHLLPQCSVLENVLLPTIVFSPSSGIASAALEFRVSSFEFRDSAGGPGSSSSKLETRNPKPETPLARAQHLLDRVGLGQRLDHRPAELSGGEKQRTALARALVNAPRLVLADEPTGNLDRTTSESVGELLSELPREHAVALLVVTHSEALARRFDRRFTLDAGRLVPCP
ncbi:MAG: ABC transporter ATP-binding protein, partial [Planctomycetota bacterium]